MGGVRFHLFLPGFGGTIMALSKCIQPASTVTSAGILLATCNGNTIQNWVFFLVRLTVYAILNQQTGMCLAVPDGSTSTVQTIQLPCQPYSSGNSALWVLQSGSKQITNSGSGLVLDIFGENSEDGTKVIQYPSHGGINQQFNFQVQAGKSDLVKYRDIISDITEVGHICTHARACTHARKRRTHE